MFPRLFTWHYVPTPSQHTVARRFSSFHSISQVDPSCPPTHPTTQPVLASSIIVLFRRFNKFSCSEHYEDFLMSLAFWDAPLNDYCHGMAFGRFSAPVRDCHAAREEKIGVVHPNGGIRSF